VTGTAGPPAEGPATATLAVPLADPALEAAVQDGLDAVEERLVAAVQAGQPLLDATARHLVDAGGKRFRPLLVLLAASLGQGIDDAVLDAAVVVELTHLATLYHDDVMDEAPMRRGAQSANDRWGNTVAILTGDFLFARAAEVVAGLGPEAVRLQAQTFARLVRGQIRETIGPGAEDEPVAHYLDVLADKTGSLIATSARFGAMFGGAGIEAVETVTAYGEAIGVAFQLADDVIDIASDTLDSGKTPGTDLREGVPTLPSLYAARSTHPDDARLVDLVTRPLTEDDEVAEALGLLRAHPALAEARRDVRRHADRARDVLAPLAPSPAKDALTALCQAVVERTG
jgi:heptaprenyl diphosphate synthase